MLVQHNGQSYESSPDVTSESSSSSSYSAILMVALTVILVRAAVLLAICDQLPIVGGAGCTAVVGESS
jgi:hypothetical protein